MCFFVREDVRTTADILSDRLRWCFQTDKLGDIVKKGSETPFLFEMYWNEDKFSYGFTKDATVKVPNVINEIDPLKSNSIFIPAKEVLSLFGIILKSREIDKVFGFDDTYYDLQDGMPSDALIRIEKIPEYTAIQQGMHISEFVYYGIKEKCSGRL